MPSVPIRGIAVRSLGVAVAALAFHLVLVASLLAQADGRVDSFVKFGAEGSNAELAARVLGQPVVHPTVESHDGVRFWVLARDPLLLDPSGTAAALDFPAYRGQRILYPWLVQPWRLGGEWSLLWGMVVTNLLVVAGGTYATARLAADRRASPWVGLVFALDPAVQLSVMYDLADALATACVVTFVLLVRRRRWGWAAAAATAAVLAKDTSLLPVLAVALFGAGIARRERAALAVPPLLVVGAWTLYQRSRLGWGTSNVSGNLVPVPFAGWLDAARYGWAVNGAYDDALVGFVVLALAVVVVVRWWRRRSLELLACLPVALATPFLALSVVNVNVNSLRSLGPVVVLLVVDLFAQRAEREQPAELAPAT
ncbi:MAG: hypothetical protein U0Q07_20790 [Acidimicrobiales bacterium]